MIINKVIICGLGALGLTYADKLQNVCELKVLANKERVKKYVENPPQINGKQLNLDYITPSDSFFPDLVIISTKSYGLDSALKYIKNFIGDNTIIISLINGISSEDKILSCYSKAKTLRSYFIGHSAMRNGNCAVQDGIGKIVIEPEETLEQFFKLSGIDYEVAEDITYSQWVKLGVNIILNEPSALYELTVGELRKKEEYNELAQNLLREVKQIAQCHNVGNLDNYEQDVFDSANLVSDEGKTSMYQDIIAKRKTEIDIFSGEILRLGGIYGIKTPYNQKIYNQILAKTINF